MKLFGNMESPFKLEEVWQGLFNERFTKVAKVGEMCEAAAQRISDIRSDIREIDLDLKGRAQNLFQDMQDLSERIRKWNRENAIPESQKVDVRFHPKK